MEFRVAGKYRVEKLIGKGTFSEVRAGVNVLTNEEVAVKLENIRNKYPQLLAEVRVYRQLQGSTGIPRVFWYGVEEEYNVMVLERLGHSLEALLQRSSSKFSLKTVLMLAEQMISRVEYLHSRNHIHRDVKPENFLVENEGKTGTVYIIDFGFCKKYRDSRSSKHIPYREGKNLTGNARYMSINTHLGIEQSRRDDIEALGYCFVYFLKGNLPWKGLQAHNKREKYSRIIERKMATSIETLCVGCPEECATYLMYARSLRFEERPDYTYIKRLFRELFYRRNYEYDLIFDWNLVTNLTRENEESSGETEKPPKNEL